MRTAILRRQTSIFCDVLSRMTLGDEAASCKIAPQLLLTAMHPETEAWRIAHYVLDWREIRRCSLDQLSDLLRRAAASTAKGTAFVVENIRTVTHVGPDVLGDVLAGVVKHPAAADAVKVLCQLPAAQYITPEALARALQVAVTSVSGQDTLPLLLEQPAADQMGPELLAELLQAALTNKRGRAHVGTLLKLPAVHCMEPKVLAKLLKAALGHATMAGFMFEFCSLPAARQVGTSDLVELLQLACHHPRPAFSAIAEICGLPAAQQIGAEPLAKLMEIAVCNPAAGPLALHHLSRLPAMSRTPGEVLEKLLTVALEHGGFDAVLVLVQLDAARKIGAQGLAELLKLALAQPKGHVPLEYLCTLPAAKELPVGKLLELLQLAARGSLCGLLTSFKLDDV